LNSSLQTWLDKFSALNARERWMVFGAGLAVIYFVIGSLLVDPVSKKNTLLNNDVAQLHSQLAEMQQQITMIEQTPVMDVDAGNKAKIALLNTTIATQSQALTELNDTLVSPALMPQLLENLMRRYTNIRLVSMKTHPPVNFIKTVLVDDGAPTNAGLPNVAEQAGVYQHGLELTLSGHYMDLLHYAEALQGLSNQVLWDKAEFSSKAYPMSELTVTVYTLSLDKTWLSI
jgi:MSHA biogenesis protein MshJ